MFIIGGNSKNVFSRAAGFTLGQKVEAKPKAFVLGQGLPEPAPEQPSVSVVVDDPELQDYLDAKPHTGKDSDYDGYASYEAWAEAQDTVVQTPSMSLELWEHWYPGVGNSNVKVHFKRDTENPILVADRSHNPPVLTKFYKHYADMDVPLEWRNKSPAWAAVDCRAVYSDQLTQIYWIEIFFHGVYAGCARLFARYNWGVEVARDGQVDHGDKLKPGDKVNGWNVTHMTAGVDKSEMLEPLAPWHAVESLMLYVRHNCPHIEI